MSGELSTYEHFSAALQKGEPAYDALKSIPIARAIFDDNGNVKTKQIINLPSYIQHINFKGRGKETQGGKFFAAMGVTFGGAANINEYHARFAEMCEVADAERKAIKTAANVEAERERASTQKATLDAAVATALAAAAAAGDPDAATAAANLEAESKKASTEKASFDVAVAAAVVTALAAAAAARGPDAAAAAEAAARIKAAAEIETRNKATAETNATHDAAAAAAIANRAKLEATAAATAAAAAAAAGNARDAAAAAAAAEAAAAASRVNPVINTLATTATTTAAATAAAAAAAATAAATTAAATSKTVTFVEHIDKPMTEGGLEQMLRAIINNPITRASNEKTQKITTAKGIFTIIAENRSDTAVQVGGMAALVISRSPLDASGTAPKAYPLASTAASLNIFSFSMVQSPVPQGTEFVIKSGILDYGTLGASEMAASSSGLASDIVASVGGGATPSGTRGRATLTALGRAAVGDTLAFQALLPLVSADGKRTPSQRFFKSVDRHLAATGAQSYAWAVPGVEPMYAHVCAALQTLRLVSTFCSVMRGETDGGGDCLEPEAEPYVWAAIAATIGKLRESGKPGPNNEQATIIAGRFLTAIVNRTFDRVTNIGIGDLQRTPEGSVSDHVDGCIDTFKNRVVTFGLDDVIMNTLTVSAIPIAESNGGGGATTTTPAAGKKANAGAGGGGRRRTRVRRRLQLQAHFPSRTWDAHSTRPRPRFSARRASRLGQAYRA